MTVFVDHRCGSREIEIPIPRASDTDRLPTLRRFVPSCMLSLLLVCQLAKGKYADGDRITFGYYCRMPRTYFSTLYVVRRNSAFSYMCIVFLVSNLELRGNMGDKDR